MSTAPIYYEPTDPPDLPMVPLTADRFEAFAHDPGAGPIEIGPNGELVVVLRGVEYVTAPAEAASW